MKAVTVVVVGLVEINVFDIKHAVIDVVLTIKPSMATWGLNTESERVKMCTNKDLKPVARPELFTQPETICPVNSDEWINHSWGRLLETSKYYHNIMNWA